MERSWIILLVASALPAFAQAPKDGFCIANATDTSHIFITETREGKRQVERIMPGGMLCADQTVAKDGIVSVFESLDALEGCARIIPRGTVEDLIAYAEFDRCAWSSHGS